MGEDTSAAPDPAAEFRRTSTRLFRGFVVVLSLVATGLVALGWWIGGWWGLAGGVVVGGAVLVGGLIAGTMLWAMTQDGR